MWISSCKKSVVRKHRIWTKPMILLSGPETVESVIFIFEIDIVTNKLVYSKFEKDLSSASFNDEHP